MDIKFHFSNGKQLLDSNIKKFEVLNGAYIGEVSKYEGSPTLICKDYNEKVIRTIPLTEETKLDLYISPLIDFTYEEKPDNRKTKLLTNNIKHNIELMSHASSMDELENQYEKIIETLTTMKNIIAKDRSLQIKEEKEME